MEAAKGETTDFQGGTGGIRRNAPRQRPSFLAALKFERTRPETFTGLSPPRLDVPWLSSSRVYLPRRIHLAKNSTTTVLHSKPVGAMDCPQKTSTLTDLVSTKKVPSSSNARIQKWLSLQHSHRVREPGRRQ
jgi:hypothetical protein